MRDKLRYDGSLYGLGSSVCFEWTWQSGWSLDAVNVRAGGMDTDDCLDCDAGFVECRLRSSEGGSLAKSCSSQATVPMQIPLACFSRTQKPAPQASTSTLLFFQLSQTLFSAKSESPLAIQCSIVSTEAGFLHPDSSLGRNEVSLEAGQPFGHVKVVEVKPDFIIRADSC